VRNIRLKRCVAWCDWGRAFEIGAQTSAPEITDVVFEDCDVLLADQVALSIQHCDHAAIHKVRFSKIRVEIDEHQPRPRYQQTRDELYVDQPGDDYLPSLIVILIKGTHHSSDKQRGTVRDVLFEDISVLSPRMPPSSIAGADPEHGVTGVTIRNLRWNGKPVASVEAARLTVGPHTRDIVVKP
jgi:hypothetical protein